MQIINLTQEPYFSTLAKWSRENIDSGQASAASIVPLTAKLVSLYLADNKPPAADLPVLIDSVFQALKKLLRETCDEQGEGGLPVTLRTMACEPRRRMMGARQRRRR